MLVILCNLIKIVRKKLFNFYVFTINYYCFYEVLYIVEVNSLIADFICLFFFFRKVEICIDGKKQGVIKKMKNSKISRLGICKIELMRNFMEIVEMLGVQNVAKDITYNELKLLSNNYQIAWNILKRDIFKVYVSKDPKLLCFTLD